MTQPTETLGAPVTCAYPGCELPPLAPVPGSGEPAPQYCDHPEHNALGAFRQFRARRKQRKWDKVEAKAAKKNGGAPDAAPAFAAEVPSADAPAAGFVPAPAAEPDTTQEVPVVEQAAAVEEVAVMEQVSVMEQAAVVEQAEPESMVLAGRMHRQNLVDVLTDLAAELPRYIEELAIITDSAAAEERIADVTRVSTQRIIAAEERALLAEQAAEQAVDKLDETQREQAAEIEAVRTETSRQVADAEHTRTELERQRERVASLEERLDKIRDEADEARRAKSEADVEVARLKAEVARLESAQTA